MNFQTVRLARLHRLNFTDLSSLSSTWGAIQTAKAQNAELYLTFEVLSWYGIDQYFRLYRALFVPLDFANEQKADKWVQLFENSEEFKPSRSLISGTRTEWINPILVYNSQPVWKRLASLLP